MNRELVEFAAQENVPLLSIDEIRPASDYTFIRRGHYSIETNRMIGEDLARWVDRVLDEEFAR